MPLPELPDDLPVVRRDAVRVVVLDEADHVLLFQTHDPLRSWQGQWWELPGGGIDPGESYVDAAVREVREETGLTATRVGAPTWTRTATFLFLDHRRIQDEVVVTASVAGITPAVDATGQFDYEQEAYLAARWWPLGDLLVTTERCYPGRLPELLPALLAGERIEEPFETWS